MLHRIALILLILCLSTAANARSGGSMGGGSFRSRSSGSSFGGSRSFSSPSSGGGSSFGGGGYSGTRFVPVPIGGSRYYGYGGGGGGTSPALVIIVILVLLAVFIAFGVAFVRMYREMDRNSGKSTGRARAGGDAIWTARVQFGMQTVAWDLVDRLDAIARKAHTTDVHGLHEMLLKSVAAIRPFVANIEFASAEAKRTTDDIEAERQFGRWTGAARQSYNREVVRADKFGVQEEQREMTTDGIHDEDGQLAVAEFFVLTIVIATRQDAPSQLANPKDVPKLLKELGLVTADQLVALEIVWTPASKSDAMSRDDMETTFPELVPL